MYGRVGVLITVILAAILMIAFQLATAQQPQFRDKPVSYFDGINQFFKDYPFISPLLASGLSAVIGAIIAWNISKKRIDIDALMEHFKEIKSEVIKPLLHAISTPSFYHLPSVSVLHDEELKPTILRYLYLDIELSRDFLDSHYPQMIPLWNKIAQSSEYIDVIMYLSTKFIDERILLECSSLGIEHRSSKNDVSSGSNGIPIVEFSDALKNLILTGTYHESLLFIDPIPPKNWIYINTDISSARGIYYSEDETRIHKVLTDLRSICNNINSDLSDEIAQYRIINNTLDVSLREFQRKLNIILRKTRLPLKKEHLFKVKCRFIKPRLE
jgi:hypothetical protein